jgi:hypothetical protein
LFWSFVGAFATFPVRAGDGRTGQHHGEEGAVMRKFLGVLAATAAIGGGIGAIPPSAVAKTCYGSEVHAVIGGEQKCLAAGEFCAARYSFEYHRYGFDCVRYASGYYHLRRRD